MDSDPGAGLANTIDAHTLLDSGTLGFLDGAIGYTDLQRRFGP